ncbi:MAG: hydrogenase [Candidatus Methanoplasma sp.]|jgi:hydrogenase-4 component E|nr:hydrogenase [Candidatus Methanoplasma sp.]
MDVVISGNLIDLCVVAMLLLSMLAMTTTRIAQLLNAFAVQSLFLAFLAFVVADSTGRSELYVLGAITLAVKVAGIPWAMKNTAVRLHAGREVDSTMGIPGSLLISAALIIVAYLVTEPLMATVDTITRNCLAMSMSVILIGLFMMVTRRKAMTEAVGLLMMENGLFLGIMSISYGMPLVVEIGIFFDVLMVAVIIGIFALRISRAFDTIDTSVLRRLKE